MIKFFRGLKSGYNYPGTDNQFVDALYFATDTGEVLMNEKCYGTDEKKVSNVVFDDATNTFTFTILETSADGLVENTVTAALGDKLLTASDRELLESVGDILETGQLDVTYNSELDSTVATVNALGGIPAGTTVAQLDGKSISEVLDTLIFPTIQPTVIAPSASISLKSGVSDIKEVGATGYSESDFNTSFNQGTIKIGSSTQAARAGAKTSDVLYAGSEANGIPATISEGTTNFYYKVYYEAGPTPLDSKGNPATSYTALPAGSVVSSAKATYGVYPFYANVENEEVSKLTLTKNTTFTTTLASEGPNKHVFKMPHTITKIEVLNTLSNQYEVYGLENFTKTTETIQVQGVDKTYNVYTRNDAGFNGELTYRITYSK